MTEKKDRHAHSDELTMFAVKLWDQVNQTYPGLAEQGVILTNLLSFFMACMKEEKRAPSWEAFERHVPALTAILDNKLDSLPKEH